MSVPQRDVIAVLTEDHERIEQLFERLERSTTASQRREVVASIRQELLRRSATEKQWLYPRNTQARRSRRRNRRSELHEHAAVEKVLKELENENDPDAPMYHWYLVALMTDVRQHIAEEESDVFPRLRGHAAGRPGPARRRSGTGRKAPAHPIRLRRPNSR